MLLSYGIKIQEIITQLALSTHNYQKSTELLVRNSSRNAARCNSGLHPLKQLKSPEAVHSCSHLHKRRKHALVKRDNLYQRFETWGTCTTRGEFAHAKG